MERYLIVNATHSGTSAYIADWNQRSIDAGIANFKSRLNLAEDKALIQIKETVATTFSGELAADQPFILGRFNEQGAHDEIMNGWTTSSGNEWVAPTT